MEPYLRMLGAPAGADALRPRSRRRTAHAGLLVAAVLLAGAAPSSAQGVQPKIQPSAAAGAANAQEAGEAPARRETYRLAPGDVVEITVAGMPDLTYRTALNVDGRVVIPLGQPIDAAGLTLDALTTRVRAVISQLPFRQPSSSAVLPPMTIPGEQIAVQIVEYRPVYLDGDVNKPGALAFRPGMTARQALAEAGGYNLMPLQARPAVLESSELLGRLHDQQLALLRERAVVARLRTEAGMPEADPGDTQGDAEASGAAKAGDGRPLEPFARIEGERASALATRFSADIDHISESLRELDDRSQQMSARQRLEEGAAAADRAELSRLDALADRRVVPLERVTEARRALMLSSSRVMDATVEAGNLEKEKQAMRRELDAVRNGRRSDILEQLSDSELRLRQIEASIEASKQQLSLLSGMRPDRLGSPDDGVRVTIARIVSDREQRLQASLETPLEAGDAVQIELSRDRFPF